MIFWILIFKKKWNLNHAKKVILIWQMTCLFYEISKNKFLDTRRLIETVSSFSESEVLKDMPDAKKRMFTSCWIIRKILKENQEEGMHGQNSERSKKEEK